MAGNSLFSVLVSASSVRGGVDEKISTPPWNTPVLTFVFLLLYEVFCVEPIPMSFDASKLGISYSLQGLLVRVVGATTILFVMDGTSRSK